MTNAMIETRCDRCDGTGERFDVTNLDMVAATPFVTCSACRGRGVIVTVDLFADLTDAQRQSMERERIAAIPECDPNADLPAWMTE